MKTCKWCNNEVSGKRVYCDDKCRMAYNRCGGPVIGGAARQGFQPEQPEQINPNKPKANNEPEQTADSPKRTFVKEVETEQAERGKYDDPGGRRVGFTRIEGQRVYSRQAVKYNISEAWDTRPEPLDPMDRPNPKNRGKYIRPDGTEYLFDACGKAFECHGPKEALNREPPAKQATAGRCISVIIVDEVDNSGDRMKQALATASKSADGPAVLSKQTMAARGMLADKPVVAEDQYEYL